MVDLNSEFHNAVTARLKGRTRGLSGHAYVEFVSVTTRLPEPFRISPQAALRLIGQHFPQSVFLPEDQVPVVVEELVRKGIGGGALYDGLVAGAARHHDLTLVTIDFRAQRVYDALGVDYELLTSA